MLSGAEYILEGADDDGPELGSRAVEVELLGRG